MLAPQGDGHWVLYAGGYSDMIAQNKQAALLRHKGKALSQRQVPTNSRVSENENPNASTNHGSMERQEKNKPRKLSYKQVYALEKLPEQIAALQDEIKKLNKNSLILHSIATIESILSVYQ